MDTLHSDDNQTLTARHLRRIDELSDEDLNLILSLGAAYAHHTRNRQNIAPRLSGRTQINLFFENSTRTNMSFELAGKRLGADVINVPVAASSVNKDEEFIDTVQTLAAMGADIMIVRAAEPGIHDLIAERIDSHVVNAGDGTHEHPTQALLDAATLIDHFGKLNGLKLAIVGDIRHSRVAASGVQLFSRLGAEVRFIGPSELLPGTDQFTEIPRFEGLAEGLQGCDAVMALRMQFERMGEPSGINRIEFHERYALTYETLGFAAPHAMVMHPGPMNRGIEIDGSLADDPDRSLILKQVFFGVPTRMAVLDALVTRQS